MTPPTVTSEGQVTIPAAVHERLGVDTGDRIEFVETEPGRLEVMAAVLPATALKGLIAKPAKPVSVRAMNAAIRERAWRNCRS